MGKWPPLFCLLHTGISYWTKQDILGICQQLCAPTAQWEESLEGSDADSELYYLLTTFRVRIYTEVNNCYLQMFSICNVNNVAMDCCHVNLSFPTRKYTCTWNFSLSERHMLSTMCNLGVKRPQCCGARRPTFYLFIIVCDIDYVELSCLMVLFWWYMIMGYGFTLFYRTSLFYESLCKILYF